MCQCRRKHRPITFYCRDSLSSSGLRSLPEQAPHIQVLSPGRRVTSILPPEVLESDSPVKWACVPICLPRVQAAFSGHRARKAHTHFPSLPVKQFKEEKLALSREKISIARKFFNFRLLTKQGTDHRSWKADCWKLSNAPDSVGREVAGYHRVPG